MDGAEFLLRSIEILTGTCSNKGVKFHRKSKKTEKDKKEIKKLKKTFLQTFWPT